jgi:hypothetical protein
VWDGDGLDRDREKQFNATRRGRGRGSPLTHAASASLRVAPPLLMVGTLGAAGAGRRVLVDAVRSCLGGPWAGSGRERRRRNVDGFTRASRRNKRLL